MNKLAFTLCYDVLLANLTTLLNVLDERCVFIINCICVYF